MEPDICTDGSQAVEMVTARMINPAASMYKLILMDYSMPRCDGPTATVQIRELLSNCSDTDNNKE